MANLKLQTGAGGLPAAPNALALADLVIVGQSGGAATTGVAYRTNFTDIKALLQAANGTALSSLVNASAQFDIIGRKTAGAGAWEDCTRANLELAVTNSSGNTFLGAQTITNANLFMSRNDALASVSFIGDGQFLVATFGYFASNAVAPFIVAQKARGSQAAPAVVATNDQIGAFNFNAYTGATYVAAAQQISFVIAGAPGAGDMESSYIIRVIQAGTAAGSDIVKLTHAVGMELTPATGGLSMNGQSIATNIGLLQLRQYTVATLPAAVGGAPMRVASVSDALGPAFGVAVAGGGAVKIPVYDDGVWKVG